MKTAGFKKGKENGRFIERIDRKLSIDRLFNNIQVAIAYIDQFGFFAGLIMGAFLLISLVPTSGLFLHRERSHFMNNITSIRIRIARFLSERYRQRERPGCFADLFLWAVIVVIAAWPMFPLARAMEMLR